MANVSEDDGGTGVLLHRGAAILQEQLDGRVDMQCTSVWLGKNQSEFDRELALTARGFLSKFV